MGKLLFQGHGSYRLITNSNTVIYVDPFIGEGYDMDADIVLVSHEHNDHNHIELINLKSDGVIIRSSDILVNGVYKTINHKDVSIEAVEAYNDNHDKSVCVGFIIRFDNLAIYASGDTSLTNDMKNKISTYNIDYALLPIDGIYNMDYIEAEKCADYINAVHTIPIHMKPMELFDEEMANKFKHKTRLIVKSGSEIDL